MHYEIGPNTKPTRSLLSGVLFFATMMLVLWIADYYIGIPPNVAKAAITGFAISAIAVSL